MTVFQIKMKAQKNLIIKQQQRKCVSKIEHEFVYKPEQ